MLHLGVMSSYIIGPFKSQQKVTFCQGNLHQDESSKWKKFQNKGVGDILSFPKSPRLHPYDER